MRRALPLALALCLTLPGLALAGPHLRVRSLPPDLPPTVLALPQAAAILARQFDGQLLRVDLTLPDPLDFALGTNLVHEFRLLTPERHILRISMDAETGEILDVAGIHRPRRHR
ncbi:MAG: PepSY domain-containing protein [Paracoccus sp. (in: a-proteobacteria)]|nr:PepSY domain-containing protein [Paracoccus sp. (in: a-proteobacteria)]